MATKQDEPLRSSPEMKISLPAAPSIFQQLAMYFRKNEDVVSARVNGPCTLGNLSQGVASGEDFQTSKTFSQFAIEQRREVRVVAEGSPQLRSLVFDWTYYGHHPSRLASNATEYAILLRSEWHSLATQKL